MANSLLKDFRTEVRSRFTEDSSSMTYSEWIVKNTRLKKVPFSFKGYEFQTAIINDMHPNMSVIKCSQIGLTEVQLRKFAAFLARNVGVSGIFTLPDDAMYRRVSTTRFAPMIESEKAFNLGFSNKPIRRMDLYQINDSFGYFLGNKETDATSINSDLNFHDEVDLSDQEMLGLFQSRLQGSNIRITQSFSTPTFESFGISSSFAVSDQHEYMVKCEHCRHYNIPEFTPKFISIPGLPSDLNDLTEIDHGLADRLDLKNANVLCEKCHEPLNLFDPSLREWVPRHAGRKGRGYRVSPFCTPRLTVEYIVEQLLQYKQKDSIRRFYNTVLGLPYNDSNARMTESEIKAIMQTPSKIDHSGQPVVVGIDMGITCHMAIMHIGNEKPEVFEWKQIPSSNLVDEVKQVLSQYNVVSGCIDRHPYTPLSEEIRDLSNGVIVPVEYSPSVTAPTLTIKKTELDELSHIQANRTQMIDAVVGMVRKRAIAFTGYGHHEALIIQHLRDMVRIEQADASAVWQKLNGNDHYLHALGYATFALRASDAIFYRSDADKRVAFAANALIMTMNEAPEINMTNRRKRTISLGAI